MAHGKSPVGRPCPRCRGAFWLNLGHYGSYMVCTSAGCGYTKAITPADAADMARLMSIKCGKCGGHVQGRKSYNGVFVGCVNYPTCAWTQALDPIVQLVPYLHSVNESSQSVRTEHILPTSHISLGQSGCVR